MDVPQQEPSVTSASPGGHAPWKAIFYGGVLVGVLDLLDATLIFWFLRGVAPYRVLQAIAGALLGNVAFGMGAESVVLGLLIHFAVAFSVVGVYAVLARVFPVLLRRWKACGVVYGLGVLFFMNLVVIPLSALPASVKKLSMLAVINGVIGHPLFVGLPAAWAIRRWWTTRTEGNAPA